MSNEPSPYITTFYFFILCLSMSALFFVMYKLANKYHHRNNNSKSHHHHHESALSSPNTIDDNSDDISTHISTNNSSSMKLSLSTYSSVLLVISLSFLWYSVNISFTVYNKWLMRSYKSGFNFPFTITFFHMMLKYLFSRIWMYLVMTDAISPLKSSIFITIIIPIGLTTALDIAFSNTSISYLTISVYTILKTTVIVWTFIWGGITGLESVSLIKVFSIIGIVCGLSLAVFSDLNASVLGISTAAAASACGGLRWVLVQMLQQADNKSKDAMVAMYRFAATTVIAMVPLVLIFELRSLLQSEFNKDIHSLIEVVELVFVGSILGCLLVVIELNLLTLTSSLNLSVIGELKEAIQILLGMIAFQDHFTVLSGVGVVIAISSAELYRRTIGSEGVNNNCDVVAVASRGDFDDMELMKLIHANDDNVECDQ